ncbi:MAG: T9SS type A sorting domain-containing protein [Bacteroidales bacterium]|nr:T9SS type A sorting domain-containing protein [Bacteroidales bacterium]
MKKILLLSLLIPFTLFSQWQAVGPSNIEVIKIVFDIDGNGSNLICASDGIYTNVSGDWEFFSVDGLTARDACKLDDENTVIIFGGYLEYPFPEEDYSITTDGIYVFNNVSKEISLVKWCNNPNFINYHYYTNRYFIGYSFGVYVSENGYNWLLYKPYYFSAWSINYSMDNYNSHISLINFYYYHSNDHGNKWNIEDNFYYEISTSGTLTSTSPREGNVKFHPNGTAYLICQRYTSVYIGLISQTSYTNSVLANSYNYCADWNLIFYTPYLKTVGFDMIGNVYLGWDAPDTCHTKGLAYYDRQTQETTFINQGLPDLHIHHITHDPEGSYTNIYVCTDIGVYFNPNPVLAVDNTVKPEINIELFPNPCSNSLSCVIPEKYRPNLQSVKIFDVSGNAVIKLNLNDNINPESIISINTANLQNGLYFYVINLGGMTLTRKFIVKK